MQSLRRVAPELAAIDDDADVGDLGLDSLDFLNLIAAIGDEAGLEIPERDYPSLRTIRTCASYLATHA